MCGIVGGIAERNLANVLVEGLKRLEYRGYDSAGLALVDRGQLLRERQVGKVAILEEAVKAENLHGHLGIAHTRWATHGVPSVANAHPHMSGHIAVVHNGIIENYQALKEELQSQGYQFHSQTDTEVVAHLVHRAYEQTPNLLQAVQSIVPLLHGAYALGIVSSHHENEHPGTCRCPAGRSSAGCPRNTPAWPSRPRRCCLRRARRTPCARPSARAGNPAACAAQTAPPPPGRSGA